LTYRDKRLLGTSVYISLGSVESETTPHAMKVVIYDAMMAVLSHDAGCSQLPL
jgi:hypothetical protein